MNLKKGLSILWIIMCVGLLLITIEYTIGINRILLSLVFIIQIGNGFLWFFTEDLKE